MDILEGCLPWGSKAELRKRLFQMVREQELMDSTFEELETLNLSVQRKRR
jgi:hypothetical protein